MFPSYGGSLYSPTNFLLLLWSSRSFSSSESDVTRSEELEFHKGKRERYSSVNLPTVEAVAESSLDLIQLKSPTTPDANNSRLPGSVTAPTRRRSAEVAKSPSIYAENERISLVSNSDYLSTVVTPTATSFSRDDLNEIFNISRDNMNIEKSPNVTKINDSTTIDNSIDMSSPDKHNLPIDESNLSLDSTLTEIFSAAPISRGFSDNNNNMNDKEPRTPIKPVLDGLNTSTQSLPMLETSSPSKMSSMPFSTPQTPVDTGSGMGSRTSSLSQMQMVCREILMTEKSYVNDLQDIIEGYIYHLKQKGDLVVESIFGNLEDIFEFNKEVLYQIEQCEMDNCEVNPIQLAKVFIDKARGFNNHYTSYCTNYPEASQFFSIIMQDPGISSFFIERQKVIGHALSLESYLLKPVQRILKYHLLLKDILKRYDGSNDGYDVINTAMLAMTDVAEYINEMKRLQENAVKVQEILNNIVYIDVPIDVYATGRLVLENTFKVHGVRSERIMYLFEKLLLICKKREDNFLFFKEKIECCNMMLVESIAKDPLGFQIMRFDNRKVNYTIIAKSVEVKKEWTKELKRLILENHAAVIPQTARQAILGPEEKAKSKYNSLQFQALDDSVMTNLKKVGVRSPVNKENAIPTAGVKRESNEKESAFSPKRPLNSKAKEYLQEKKGRNPHSPNSNSPASPLLSPSSHHGEKEKKEKRHWIKRHKHKTSLDCSINLDGSTCSDMNTDEHSPIKSRSLESLKDAMKTQDDSHEEVNSNILKDIINYDFEQQVNDVIQEIQPMQTNVTDKSSIMTVANDDNDVELPVSITDSMTDTDTDPDTPKHIDQLGIPDPEKTIPEDVESGQQFDTGIRITKSNSVALRKKGGSADDILSKSFDKTHHQRWSTIPTDTSRLEHRLSLLSEDGDDLSITSIKNMVRKVSNAFNSAYQVYDDGSRNNTFNESHDVSRDLGKILGSTPLVEKQKITYRKSTGSILNPSENAVEEFFDVSRSKSECSSYETEQVTDTVESVGVAELNDDLSKRWSTDVDQVFDEVNADLDSIADSIASDAARSEPEEGPTYVVTSVGMDISHRAAIVDMRLKEANSTENILTPNSTKKVNVEVKRVADRIKEYKKLVDAEKRRTSWRRREPKTMNEMMENLDTINSANSCLTPTYSNLRRRYRASKDLDGYSINSSSDPSPRSSCSSIKRSLSETFAGSFDNEKASSVSFASSPRASERSDDETEKTLIDSVNALNTKKDKTLDNSEEISTRTNRYKKALENFDAKARLPSTGEPKAEQTIILRRRPKDDRATSSSLNVVCRDSGDWTRKAQTLPHPRRTNAIKRIARTNSDELSDDSDVNVQRLQSFDEDKTNDTSSDVGSSDENKISIVVSKRTHRSTSLPRQKKRQVNNTIHEEVSPKYVHQRLSTRSNSNESNMPKVLNRGRQMNNNNAQEKEQQEYLSSTRGRRREPKTLTPEKPTNSVRSVSLPRRAPGVNRNKLIPQNGENKENEHEDEIKNIVEESSSITILRSPSIRCIQSNHVNNRIKDYFTNLQKSTKVSRSRPNLVIIGNSSSDSDPDLETSSLEATSSNDEGNSNNNNTEKEQILKGTVRSMIQRYGKQNYVFD